MPSEPASAPLEPDLRFDDAPEAAVSAPTCARCSLAIDSEYYAAGGAIICSACKAVLETEATAGRAGGRVSLALLYGLGGAVAGAALYYAIAAVTGYEIGLVAIAVGWMVGRAVQLGSGHRGGRVYQVLAVALTYVAIVSTYIPYMLDDMGGTAVNAGALLAFALAAPFLAGLKNIIGLLIIGFALWQAWQMNRPTSLAITGPYAVAGVRVATADQG